MGELEKKKYAGSYVGSNVKALKSWLSHNDIEITGRIRIRGESDAPTLREEKSPDQPELHRIFLAATAQQRSADVLISHCGFRLETLGDFGGDDGLAVSDFPEMVLELKKREVSFKKIPTMVVVRPNLSKAGHQYFSFLTAEGCEYIKQYLEARMRSGEKLGLDSAIISPKYSDNKFITTNNIGDLMRTSIRKAGFNVRPYVLRCFFDTQSLIAESKGLLVGDYRKFFMGHKGNIEARYTVNKHRLPEALVEDMREKYQRASELLQTVQTSQKQSDQLAMLREQLLFSVEYTQEKVDQIKSANDLGSMKQEDFNRILHNKQTANAVNNGSRYKLVPGADLENTLMNGNFRYVDKLDDGRCLLEVADF